MGELYRVNLGDHVNFDASTKWHLCHTDGAARMDASLTEYLDKELRRPIRDFVRFCEVRRAINYDEKLYDSSNVIKIAHSALEQCRESSIAHQWGTCLASFHAFAMTTRSRSMSCVELRRCGATRILPSRRATTNLSSRSL